MRLDEFLPAYGFNEVHGVKIQATPEQVFAAIKELTPGDLSPLVHIMLDIRSLPARLTGKASSTSFDARPFLEQLYEGGFIPLAEVPNREIVFGLVGQFWKLAGGDDPGISTAEEFLAFNNPSFAKTGANLAVLAGENNGVTHCTTETRIHVPDPNTRRKFAFYWRLICLGSGWIRVMWLRAIKRKAERD